MAAASTSSKRTFRRLQRVGKATYSISLPKRWVVNRGLRPGDLLELDEDLDGSLRVTPLETRSKPPSCRIDADLYRDENVLRNIVKSGYRVGFDVIKIAHSQGSKLSFLRELEKITRDLPGMELAGEKGGEITLRYVLDHSRYSLDDLIHREQILVSAILSNIIDFLETRKYDLIPYIRDLGARVEELSQLLTRLIITQLKRRELGRFLKPRSASHLYASITMLTIMRHLTADLLSLSEALPKLRKKIWSNPEIYDALREGLRRSLQTFDEAMNAYFSMNFERANQLLSLPSDHLSSEIEELLGEKRPKDRELSAFMIQLDIFLRKLIEEIKEVARLILDISTEVESRICKAEV